MFLWCFKKFLEKADDRNENGRKGVEQNINESVKTAAIDKKNDVQKDIEKISMKSKKQKERWKTDMWIY